MALAVELDEVTVAPAPIVSTPAPLFPVPLAMNVRRQRNRPRAGLHRHAAVDREVAAGCQGDVAVDARGVDGRNRDRARAWRRCCPGRP